MQESLFSRAEGRRKSADDSCLRLWPMARSLSLTWSRMRRKASLRRRNREQLVVREDLRDLSRLLDLARIEIKTALLPERVARSSVRTLWPATWR